jgi:hypothetical protein
VSICGHSRLREEFALEKARLNVLKQTGGLTAAFE